VADVNANIRVGIDNSEALNSLRQLQTRITNFNNSVVKSSTTAVQKQAAFNQALRDSIEATGKYSTYMSQTLTSTERFGRALEKNKLSLGQYFKYGLSQVSGFSKVFKKEFQDISGFAEERVKRLQTQYISLGRTTQGIQKSLAIRPNALNLGDYNTQLALAGQRQQILNKLLHDGTTALVNFGKNTQWAGRQLMVGFSIPLSIFGASAARIFSDLEMQAVKFRRVYGDLFTTQEETQRNLDAVNELALGFTQYGVAVKDTIGLAAQAAAAGRQNQELMAATAEATRLSVLGQIDQNQALDATIALQSAFRLSNEQLAESVNFLNAVENQTVVSLDDITAAIPRVATVIVGLGGDVKDLAVFLAAMQEGGVSAEQGANALKSGLASLINPTKAATEQLASFGININSIVKTNQGDLMGTVMAFSQALKTLNEFEKQQALESVFGKYQYARLGALFENLSRQGSQAQQVMTLTEASVNDLAGLAEKELNVISQSTTMQFKAAVEQLKLAVAPLGQTFMQTVTPVIELITKILKAFETLPDGVKRAMVVVTAAVAGIGPILLMTIGLVANGFGNLIKGINLVRNGFNGLFSSSKNLGGNMGYLSVAELDAAASSASLEGTVNSLTSSLLVQDQAVKELTQSYVTMASVADAVRTNLPSGFNKGIATGRTQAPQPPMRFATGGFVPGTGNKDNRPALLTPGEFVMNAQATKKFAPILSAMNQGNVNMLASGDTTFAHIGSMGAATAQEVMSGGTLYGSSKNFIEAIVNALGGQTEVRRYSGLGFDAPKLTKDGKDFNNALKNGTMALDEFNEFWDESGVTKWNTSLKISGTKIDEVSTDLQQFDNVLKQEINTRSENNLLSDRIIEEAYVATKQQVGAQQKVTQKFQQLENTLTEVRVNLSQTQLSAAGLTETGGFVQLPGSRKIRLGGDNAKRRSIGGLYNENISAATGIAMSELNNGIRLNEKTIRQLGVRSGEIMIDGVKKGTGVASPSKQGIYIGKSIADGIAIGIKNNPAPAVAVSQIAQNMSPMGAINNQTGPGGYSGFRLVNPFRGTPAYEQMKQERYQAAFGDMKPMAVVKNNLTKLSGKVLPLMFALDGLTFAASMAGGKVGEIANKALPIIFAMQGMLAAIKLLPKTLLRFLGPVGLVVGGLMAFNTIINNAIKKGQDLGKAMTVGIDALNGMATFFGNTTATQKAITANAVRAGVTPEQLTQGQEFLKTDAGKGMLDQARLALQNQGPEFSNIISRQLVQAVMSGAVTTEQAQSISAALTAELGRPGMAVGINAQIRELLGPNNSNLLQNPLQLAVNLNAANQKALDNLINAGLNGPSGVVQVVGAASAIGAAGANTLQSQVENMNAISFQYDDQIAKATTLEEKQRLIAERELTIKELKDLQKETTDKLVSAGTNIGDPLSNFFGSREISRQLKMAMELTIPDQATREFFVNFTKEGLFRGAKPIDITLRGALASGQLDANSLKAFIESFTSPKEAKAQLKILTDQYAMDEVNRILQVSQLLDDDKLRGKLNLDLEGVSKENLDSYLEGARYITENPNLKTRFQFANADRLIEVGDRLKSLETLPNPLTKDIITNFMQNNFAEFSFAKEQIDEILALPAESQRTVFLNLVAPDQKVLDAAAQAGRYGGMEEYYNVIEQGAINAGKANKDLADSAKAAADALEGELSALQQLLKSARETKELSDNLNTLQKKYGLSAEAAGKLNAEASKELLSKPKNQIKDIIEQIDNWVAREKLLQLQQMSSYELANLRLEIDQKNVESSIDAEERRIDVINRQNELSQRQISIRQRGLQELGKKEDVVNKLYDARISVLDRVSQANDRLAQQQQSQIDLATALSSGDIASAAKTVVSMNQAQAQYQLEDTRSALEQQRQVELQSLTVSINGQLLTRAQIQQQISDIEEVIYQRQQQIQIIEDRIYVLNQEKQTITDQIAVNTARQQQAEYNHILNIIKSNEQLKIKSEHTKRIRDYLRDAAIYSERISSRGFNKGGLVRGFAAGGAVGGLGNTDTVPAMLTPGEFVVRKSVARANLPLLQSLNSNVFPDMSAGAELSSIPVMSAQSSTVNAPVYNNYSVNVNVPNTDASANDIANAVMSKIRMNGDRSIRRNRI
jgi:TP901 family phage tail tape measure protein